ncbi:MAG TPA: tetratricopeptide repeat protein [Pyrinomonadaceae bacterium]
MRTTNAFSPRSIARTKEAMSAATHVIASALVMLLLGVTCLVAQQQQGSQPPQPEFIRRGQQLTREGKLEEALALYRQEFNNAANAVQAQIAAGIVLDLMGRSAEARQIFGKAIEAAATSQAKANAQRRMAMSYAFENDCRGAARFAQQVFDYHVSQKNFFQQGEIANELARVCLEAGDVDTAEKWYKTGYEAGLQEPDIKPARVALWKFRWEHAQGRIAARRNRKEEALKHVAAAKAILDQNPEMAKDQMIFFPYLAGYVAFYTGDYKTALAELQKANQEDAFIQVLIAQTYEKLGQTEKAMEFYRKAAQATSHNPPVAYARPLARKKLGMK